LKFWETNITDEHSSLFCSRVSYD